MEIVVINKVVDASEDEGATTKQIHLQYNYNMHKTILLFPVRMEGLLIVSNVTKCLKHEDYAEFYPNMITGEQHVHDATIVDISQDSEDEIVN